MENDPEFHPCNGVTPSPDEQKRRAARQLARLRHQQFLPFDMSQTKYSVKVLLEIFKTRSIFFFYHWSARFFRRGS